MTIGTKTLDEIEAALAKATPGRWSDWYEPTQSVVESDLPPVGSVVCATPLGQDDAKAIAMLRNNAAALIAEARAAARLREVLGALVDALPECTEYAHGLVLDRGGRIAWADAIEAAERELGRRK